MHRTTTRAVCPSTAFDVPGIIALRPYAPSLLRELRSSHAGELGAVWIYKGASSALHLRRPLDNLWIASQELNDQASLFAGDHIIAEQRHLDLFDQLVPSGSRNRLQVVWRVCGWQLGFVPTILFGPRALFQTVAAVESFVENHYQRQISSVDALVEQGQHQFKPLRDALASCCEDEVHHKEDASDRYSRAGGSDWFLGRWWRRIVTWGSSLAVEIAKQL